MKTRFVRAKRAGDRDGRRPAPRTCTRCDKPYFRRNLIEVWDARAPGHRDGWHKTVAKICMSCQSIPQAQRVLVVAHAAPQKGSGR